MTRFRILKSRPSLAGIWCTGAALTVLANGASAQADIANGEAKTLPSVRVEETVDDAGYAPKRAGTATKTDTPLIETPQSISVITPDRIEAIGATRLKEALTYTPGVNSSPWGNDSQYDWIYLRGFDAYSPGFYLDGQQLRNSGSWGVWQTENYGSERIEVLRGPSSVLYGLNGPGGMVNVISKRPTRNGVRELRVQLGEDSRRQVAGDISGSLNSDGELLYRLTALAQDAELSTGDDLDNDRQFVAPALTWTPSEQTEITLLSQFLRIRTASVWSSYPAIGTLLPTPDGRRIAVDTFIGEPDFNRYDQDQWTFGYLLEHRFNNTWTVRHNARYGEFDTDYRTFYNVRWRDSANPQLLDRTPFVSDEEAGSFTTDTQLQATVDIGSSHHTVLMGLDYQRTNMDVVAYYTGGTADPIDPFAPSYGGTMHVAATPYLSADTVLSQLGVYLQDQIRFANRWVATLGARQDRATVDSANRLLGTTSKNTQRELTKRAGLVYLAPNSLAPYLSYSESFSPLTTVNPNTGRPFEPETGRQYEIGVRYQPAQRKSLYSLAVFDTRRQNYLTYNQGIPQQTGEVTMRGAELEAVFQPISRINMIAAYTWMPKADVTKSSAASSIGKQLTPVSEHVASLWSDYRFDIGLKFGLGARYVGSHRGYAETAPQKIPDYTLLDASISYELGPWTIAVNTRNLTDKKYVATCSGQNCSYGDTRNVIASGTYLW